MKFCNLLLIVSIFCITNKLFAQKNIEEWHTGDPIKNAISSFDFREVISGKVVHQHNSNLLLNPASTIKLITSFSFLEEFGEDYAFTTSVSYRGNIEKDGTLKGDIIFHGNGDPSFGSLRYGEKNGMDVMLGAITAAIKDRGITCIDGNVIVDASDFGSDCTPHSWQYNDLGNYYASGVWSTNINENAYKLGLTRSTVRSNRVKLKNISPTIPGLYFENELTLGPADSGDEAYIFCAPYQDHAFIRGSIPAGKSTFYIRGAIPDVPLFIGTMIQLSLENADIKSMKVIVDYNGISKKKSLWKHQGITADKQVRSAIHRSINLYCEAFYKALGKGDRESAGENISSSLLDSKAIENKKEVKISDGSGLSQRNYVSTSTMTRFLISQHKNFGAKKMHYYLARNGYDGTLKNAFKTKNLKGKIYGKSGSMGGVRAYAGFLTTKKGKEFAFSIMVNNYTSSSRDVYLHIQALLEEVYRVN